VKRGSLFSLGFGVLFSVGLSGYGCSSNSGSTPTVDAGKKETGGGTGGTTGSGGSSGTGDASSTGGSSASGGSSATGGSSVTGGVTSAGGAVGGSGSGGGSTGSGGSSQAGGSSGGGGSPGTGGSGPVDGGGLDSGSGGSSDGGASDAVDAPLPEDDVPVATDDGGASTDGSPHLVDTGATDVEIVDATRVDVGVILVDAAEDASEPVDSPAVVDTAEGVDVASIDAGPLACLNEIISNGYASTGASPAPCSACLDPSDQSHLDTQCKGMIDCLLATSCPTSDSHGNCWLACRNAVAGNQIATESCVSALTTAAGCQRIN
jgi:hypothetical protein